MTCREVHEGAGGGRGGGAGEGDGAEGEGAGRSVLMRWSPMRLRPLPLNAMELRRQLMSRRLCRIRGLKMRTALGESKMTCLPSLLALSHRIYPKLWRYRVWLMNQGVPC
jgi:hypothetical protein